MQCLFYLVTRMGICSPRVRHSLSPWERWHAIGVTEWATEALGRPLPDGNLNPRMRCG